MRTTNLLTLTAVLAAVLAGCAEDNPPITREIQWADAETEALVRRACYDCHSNETDWKLIHQLPGVRSWVNSHVYDGRCVLNFSEWDRPQPHASMAAAAVLGQQMPLESYAKHRERGVLTLEERKVLANGITQALTADPPPTGAPDCVLGADTGTQ